MTIPVEAKDIEVRASRVVVPVGNMERIGVVSEILVISPDSDRRFVRMSFPDGKRPALWLEPGKGVAMAFGDQPPPRGKTEATQYGRLYQIRYVRDGVEFIHPFTNANGFPKLATVQNAIVAWPVEVNGDKQLL